MPLTARPGVFCLEGDWSNRLTDRSSVRPLLDLVEQLGFAKTIYRDIGTPAELEHYVSKWTQKRYAAYGLGYFAFHGTAGALWIGPQSVSLEQLGELIDGRGAGRIVHFGSCSTLDVDDATLQGFLKSSGLRAVSGYGTDIEWLESAAFDLLLIDALTRYQRADAAFKGVVKRYPDLMKRLDLRYAWRTR